MYLQQYHRVREGLSIGDIERNTLKFRALSNLGDEAFAYTYTTYSGHVQQCAVTFFRVRNALTEISYCTGLPEESVLTGLSLAASDAAVTLAR